MKRVAVTGGTGFIGSNLARRLLRDGQDVHLLVRPGYSPWRIEAIRDHVRIHELDMSDLESLTQTVGLIRPDWIFHLATHGAYSWQTDLQEIVRTNISSTFNLVEACLARGFEAFVNSGTSSEYGFKNHAPSETEWPEPNSDYAVTKASATMFCRFQALSRQANVTTLRLYSVYGPYEEPNRLIPSLVVHGLSGGCPPLASPDIARDYVFTEDAIDAFILAAARPTGEPGAVYNVGTGLQTTLRDVVEAARRVIGIEAEPVWGSMENRKWDTDIWVSDSRRIRDELGWRPKHPLEEGFRETVDWFVSHPELLDFYRRRLGVA